MNPAPVALLRPAGMPAGMDPREWRKAIELRLNELLDQSIALISALDSMEADCDLEETGDAEPWLGWTDRGQMGEPYRLDGTPHYDLERDESDDEDGGDGEPDADSEADADEGAEPRFTGDGHQLGRQMLRSFKGRVS